MEYFEIKLPVECYIARSADRPIFLINGYKNPLPIIGLKGIFSDRYFTKFVSPHNMGIDDQVDARLYKRFLSDREDACNRVAAKLLCSHYALEHLTDTIECNHDPDIPSKDKLTLIEELASLKKDYESLIAKYVADNRQFYRRELEEELKQIKTDNISLDMHLFDSIIKDGSKHTWISGIVITTINLPIGAIIGPKIQDHFSQVPTYQKNIEISECKIAIGRKISLNVRDDLDSKFMDERSIFEIASQEDQNTALQIALKKFGCYEDKIDGKWGPNSRRAASQLNHALPKREQQEDSESDAMKYIILKLSINYEHHNSRW